MYKYDKISLFWYAKAGAKVNAEVSSEWQQCLRQTAAADLRLSQLPGRDVGANGVACTLQCASECPHAQQTCIRRHHLQTLQ